MTEYEILSLKLQLAMVQGIELQVSLAAPGTSKEMRIAIAESSHKWRNLLFNTMTEVVDAIDRNVGDRK